jgi:hypothetical protein
MGKTAATSFLFTSQWSSMIPMFGRTVIFGMLIFPICGLAAQAADLAETNLAHKSILQGQVQRTVTVEKHNQRAITLSHHEARIDPNSALDWVRFIRADQIYQRLRPAQSPGKNSFCPPNCHGDCARRVQIDHLWQKIERQPDNANVWLQLSNAYGWEEHDKALMACRIAHLTLDAQQDVKQDSQMKEDAGNMTLVTLPK